MHLLVLCSTSCNTEDCALRTTYPMMARWQDKVASLLLLSRPAQLSCCFVGSGCAVAGPSRFQRKVRATLSQAEWENVVLATGRLLLLLMRTTIVHVMKHM